MRRRLIDNFDYTNDDQMYKQIQLAFKCFGIKYDAMMN